MKHIYTYEEHINENLLSRFKDDIKMNIKKKIDELSEHELIKLKKILYPYYGMSKEEIEADIRLKLEQNHLDPYGEEEWDPNVDSLRAKYKRIFHQLDWIFGPSAGFSLCGFLLSIVLYSHYSEPLYKNIVIGFGVISLITVLITLLVEKLYKKVRY